MALYRLSGNASQVPVSAFVASETTLIGQVVLLDAPAKVMRELTDAEVAGLADSASDYANRATLYCTELERIG